MCAASGLHFRVRQPSIAVTAPLKHVVNKREKSSILVHHSNEVIEQRYIPLKLATCAAWEYKLVGVDKCLLAETPTGCLVVVYSLLRSLPLTYG